jgi:excisionase family DNA binding protein
VKLLLRKAEVAEALGCSLSTVDRLERAGKLLRVQLGGAPRWKARDVEALIDQLPSGVSHAKTAAATAARRSA